MRAPTKSITGKVISTVATIASAFTFGACDANYNLLGKEPVISDPCVTYVQSLQKPAQTSSLEVPSSSEYCRLTVPFDTLAAKIANPLPLNFYVELRDPIARRDVPNYPVVFNETTYTTGENGIVKISTLPNAITEDECIQRARLAEGETPIITVYMMPKIDLNSPYKNLLGFAVGLYSQEQLGITDRIYTPEELLASGFHVRTKSFNTQTSSRMVFSHTENVSPALIADLKNLFTGGDIANYIDPRLRPASYWDDFHPLTEMYGRQIFVYEPDTVSNSVQTVIRFNQARSQQLSKGTMWGGKPLEYNLILIAKGSYPELVKNATLHEVKHLTADAPHSWDTRHLISAAKSKGTGKETLDEVLLFLFGNVPVWDGNFQLGFTVDLSQYSND